MKVVNLARRPFVNSRPVVRLTVLLWILAVLLLAANFLFYSRYWRDSAENRGKLAAVEEEMRREEASLAQVDRQFAALDLEEQTQQVIFLNWLIKHRTFPWSALFDDLEKVLPLRARLTSVQPEVHFEDPTITRRTSRNSRTSRSVTSRGRRIPARERAAQPTPALRRPPAGPDEVELKLAGFAESDEALMELVDALYASPSFKNPILRGESRDAQRGEITFNMEVVYLTPLADESAAAEPTTTAVAAGESAVTPGEPVAPEAVVADSGPGPEDEPAAGGSPETAAPSDEGRTEVAAAMSRAGAEERLSRDARRADLEPDRSAMADPSQAPRRVDAADDSQRPDDVRSGARPPAANRSGYRPPAVNPSGYRPPAAKPADRSAGEPRAGYRPPAPPAETRSAERPSDPAPSEAPSSGRESDDDTPSRPEEPSGVKPSASDTPRLQGALPFGSRVAEEART